MEEQRTELEKQGAPPSGKLAYRRPELANLGQIQALVQSCCGNGGDNSMVCGCSLS